MPIKFWIYFCLTFDLYIWKTQSFQDSKWLECIDKVTSVFISKEGLHSLLICLNEPLYCLMAVLLLYEMLWEFQKQGPWTNHDACTHTHTHTHCRAKNNRNCHDACTHYWALTSPITPSISMVILRLFYKFVFFAIQKWYSVKLLEATSKVRINPMITRDPTWGVGEFSCWHGIRICACLLGYYFAKFGIVISGWDEGAQII